MLQRNLLPLLFVGIPELGSRVRKGSGTKLFLGDVFYSAALEKVIIRTKGVQATW